MKAARIIAITMIVLSVLTVSLAITARVMEKRMGPLILDALSNELTAEVNVKNIKFSAIKKFPDASIELKDLYIKPDNEFLEQNAIKGIDTDTLVFIKRAFLEFNALDILRKQYNIQSIEMNAGKIRLLVDKNGVVNYQIINRKNTKKREIAINLNKLSLKDVDFILVNQIKNTRLATDFQHFSVTGKIQSDSSMILGKGNLKIRDLTINSINYPVNQNVDLNLSIQKAADNYVLDKSIVKISGIQFFTSGNVHLGKDRKMKLKLSASNAELNSIIHLLPQKYRNQYKDYEAYGNFSFHSYFKGKTSKSINPNIRFEFSLNNGSFINNATGMILSDLAFAGKYSNGRARTMASSSFDLEKFSFTIDNSFFEGKGKVRNFTSPDISLNANLNIDLAQIQEFFAFDTIEKARGKLKSKFWFDARFNDIRKPTLDELKSISLRGETYLQEGSLKIKENPHALSQINAKAVFADNDLRISKLSLVDGINQLKVEGLITNLIPFILVDSQQVFIDANLFAEYFDLESYLFVNQENKQSNSDSSKVILPDNIAFSLGLDMHNFVYRNFLANNLKGLVHYNKGLFSAEKIVFNTMDGSAFANGTLQQNPNKSIELKLDSRLDTIDINQLFYSFNNFKQEFILQENLAGQVSGNIKYAMQWDDQLNVIRDDIFAEGDLLIKNGELIEFDPMQSLSRFADVEELKHVRFSELKNTIYIIDQKIVIPKMIIASSAFSLGVSGEHGFDNTIDYHISVLLSEVLSRRFKSKKRSENEFTNIEDDGLGRTTLYLAIQGSVDDYKVSYDRRRARKKIKEELSEEKREIKTIIKEEFSKDDSIKKRRRFDGKEKPRMMFEFEGDTIQ